MSDTYDPSKSEQWQRVEETGAQRSFVSYLDRGAALLREDRLERARLLELESGCSVLDVGCGAGEFLIEAAGSVAGLRAFGIDTSETMVSTASSRAREAGVSVEFRLGDAQRLDFPDASFDRVNCSRVLLHLDDPSAAIAETSRVLSPGGRIGISEPDLDAMMIDSDDIDISRAVRLHLTAGYRNPDIGRRLRRLLLGAGFEIGHLSASVPATTSPMPLEMHVRQFPLRDHLESAIGAGDVQRDKAESWWRSLEAADATGALFIGGVLFRAIGIKPAAPR
jgi:SAM-dependent methyltransferase